MVTYFLTIIGIYFITGLLFAIPFSFCWVGRIDPTAQNGTLGFRLLIIPGAAALWPFLLKRTILRQAPPLERTAHRRRENHR